MTIAHYTNSVSAHQLPLDRELVRIVGADNFRYVYTGDSLQHGAQEVTAAELWIVRHGSSAAVADFLETCDLLIVGGIRPIDLMERRVQSGKATFYMAERWFKPRLLYLGHREIRLPGCLRILHPGYFKMARRFVRLFDYPAYRFLPIGFWSRFDMAFLCRLFRRRLPSGRLLPWGDFVASSVLGKDKDKVVPSASVEDTLRVLWVGRFLRLKHVETILRAVAAVARVRKVTLTLVGSGSEETYLRALAARLAMRYSLPTDTFAFRPPVDLASVRAVMRAHDVYVFSSNGFDGWGAVVQEALTEGMVVLGTHEAGACARLLPATHRFDCGDWRRLADLLAHPPLVTGLHPGYTAAGGARRILRAYGRAAQAEIMV